MQCYEMLQICFNLRTNVLLKTAMAFLQESILYNSIHINSKDCDVEVPSVCADYH